jgi:hypothetical protein
MNKMTIRKKVERKVEVGEGDNKKEIEIVIQQPNNDILKRAERYKSKVWNEAIQDGVLTKKELSNVLKERGVWSDEKSEEEKALTASIIALEKKLYHGDGKKKPKLSEGRDIAIEIRKRRMELRTLLTEKIALEENTADNLADNARFDYLVAHCTFFKNGSPVYKDFADYDSRSADEVAFAAASVLSQMLYNLDSSFEKKLPENLFLLKYELVNDSLSLINPNNPDELIDTEGRRIDKDGYYLDEDGNRIDKEGNPIGEDGNYNMIDYENDLVLPKPKVKATKEPEPEPEKEATES